MTTPAEKELSRTEYEEMINHLLYHDSIEEIEKDTTWHQNVLNDMVENDPQRRRFDAIVKSNKRILELKQRHAEFGVVEGHLAV